MRKTTGLGIIVLLLIVLISGGFSAVGNAISSIGLGLWEIIKGIIPIVIQFPSELGITDYINTKVFLSLIHI